MPLESQQKAIRLHNVIAGQNRALELALEGASIESILGTLAQTVEAQSGPEVRASVLLMDVSGTKMSVGAGPSMPPAYNKALQGIPIGPMVGSCGRAAYMKETVSVADIATDPLWKDFKDLALSHNLRACWSTPILSSTGKVLGTFAIYRTSPGNPNPDDFEIVNLVVRTAAIILDQRMQTGVREKAENFLDLALSASRIGFWDYDFATGKVELSDILKEDWGFKPTDKVDKLEDALARVHEEDVGDLQLGIAESQENNLPFDVTYRVRKAPTNEIRWIWAKGQILKDSNGNAVRLVGTSVDITEQKKTERILRDSEKQLAAYAEAMPQMAFIADAHGNITYYNKRFYDFIGMKDGNVTGWGWQTQTILHPDDIANTTKVWTQAVRTGSFYETEYRIRRADGKFIWHMGRAVPFRDEEGNITRWYGTNTDIHTHKMALRKNEGFLEAVLQTIDTGVVACDGDGKLNLFNRATTEFHGLPLEKIPTEEWSKHYNLFEADGTTPMAEENIPLYRALQGQSVENQEMVIAPKNGSPRHILASGSQLTDASGEKIGAVVAMNDVTELVKAERALNEFNVALQSANQELEAFAYSVSHDLRAPLRGIDGFSKALLQDYDAVLDETGKKYLNFIRDGVQRMGQLIDDLLKLSRLTRADMKRQKVDMSHLAQDVVDRLKQMEPERTIEVQIQPGLVVQGDLGLLTVMMENLIANSWKFTSKKTGSKIEFGQDKKSSTYYVRDNGAGFDMAHKDKLFGVFQRLHTAKEFKGTGIGLATVRRVIHRHGGKVWAEAAPEKGATFFFTFD